MNRKIEFRAYSPKWGKVIYHNVDGYTINVLTNTAWHSSSDDECIVLMQYTGLKDKNGKQIYEGDILRSTSPLNEPNLSIVEWESDTAKFHGSALYNEIYIGDRMCPGMFIHLEVVGNIFENEELLLKA